MTTLLRTLLDNQAENADNYGDAERIAEYRARADR